MATNIRKLNVSLTKHGAHKIAILLRKYDKDQILKHLAGSEPGINIESAQAKKNLSVSPGGVVPELWNEARQKGSETIDALTLIAIIFSHYLLIDAIRNSTDRSNFAGTLKRGQFTDEKAFTNIAHTIEMLGFSIEHSKTHIRYDFHKIFQIPGLQVLVEKLLRLKLISAGWDQNVSIIDEATNQGFHEVLSLSKEQFGSWLVTGSVIPERQKPAGEIEDQEFFVDADDDRPAGKFEFRPGHNEKKTGVVFFDAKQPQKATLLHNEIQNGLFTKLVKIYGKDHVGTEVPTGNGTAIDVVVKTDNFCWFYEIKTASTVKACIRQAIPQLLEYAYWHCVVDLADKLIIVTPKKITPQACAYLSFIRKQFKLNIYYEQFKLD